MSSHNLLEESVGSGLVGSRVDLHSIQIADVLDLGWLAGKLLIESIRQVVSGVGRDEQNL